MKLLYLCVCVCACKSFHHLTKWDDIMHKILQLSEEKKQQQGEREKATILASKEWKMSLIIWLRTHTHTHTRLCNNLRLVNQNQANEIARERERERKKRKREESQLKEQTQSKYNNYYYYFYYTEKIHEKRETKSLELLKYQTAKHTHNTFTRNGCAITEKIKRS